MSTLLPTLPRVAPPPPLSDEELVASIIGGNGAALELLMRRHNQRLFRLARAIVRNSSEAEDIVQETYVRAYTNLVRFEGRSSVATWLSRIALHEALRTRRRQRRARSMGPADMDRMHAANPGEAGSDPMDRAEARTMLTTALDSLPAGLRAVVMLRLVEGLSTRETAECLRLTEANVKVSLHRARRLLAETIQRRAISEFRQQFAFAEQRCDRIVAGVFRRLDVGAVRPAATRPSHGRAQVGLPGRVGAQFSRSLSRTRYAGPKEQIMVTTHPSQHEPRTTRSALPWIWLGIVCFGAAAVVAACASMAGGDGSGTGVMARGEPPREREEGYDATISDNAARMMKEGKQIFRFDTFGSEDFWGGQLRLHEALAGEKLGGVGSGVSPRAALALGLKVDAEAIPADLAAKIKAGQVDLDDPATTAALLRLNAVVGVTGFFSDAGKFQSLGIQCALCHSTVDDSFMPGIGKRLDGWGNRDLNIGAIVATAPNLKPFAELLGVDEATVRTVLRSWGPGRYDAELNMDGKAMRPDGKSAATMMPSAFGLAGVNQHTWTGGWGTVTYWNAYVANTQMYGKGTFTDSRLENAEQYPVAAKAGWGHKRDNPDLITAKLPALHFYQLAMPAPKAPKGSFDERAAIRGAAIFNGKANCAACHVPPIFTEPGHNLHTAKEMGIDDFQANRGPGRSYVTTPLRALFDTQKIHKGGFYHDGRFADLDAVIRHYEKLRSFNLTDQERRDLVEYLKSL